ncbi:glycosyltransferase [Bacillus suaedae]|uniref:Glycosyltransferase n=1 Tax=Halalkalibacter suaedae TaxID=2822140 RepID=A0A940WTD0_9BACI|nr:glycosyltransferase [Bacillus suaedae]MBP3950077.1 glycosyltransferase [Bacillus suaedae]
MKICFLSGASVIHTVRWVNAMAERGHEVTLISLHAPSMNKFHKDVKVIHLKFSLPIGYYIASRKVRRILEEVNPDIVNAHFASGYGTLSRLTNFKPTLLSVWGSDVFSFPTKSKLKQRILKKNLLAATLIASTSEVMKEKTESLVNHSKPIALTPFGVDIERFKRVDTFKNNEDIVIGTIKTLEEIYGVNYLIEAVGKLVDRLNKEGHTQTAKRIRLLIVGEGSQYEDLQTLAVSNNISSITTFTGAVPHEEVPKYLNKIDVFCALSLQESFGVAVIEASSCEIPVIVSNVGGLPEVVLDGETGFVVESKNSSMVAARLYEYVMDQSLREAMGKKGRELVKRKYNWTDNIIEMENLYKSLVNRKEVNSL